MNQTEVFIKGSNNRIELTLTEDMVPVDGVWQQIDIFIGNPPVVTVTRLPGDPGIDITAGVLNINPAALALTQAELDALVDGALHCVWVRLTSSADPDGVDFGAPDSIDTLHFLISERPA